MDYMNPRIITVITQCESTLNLLCIYSDLFPLLQKTYNQPVHI